MHNRAFSLRHLLLGLPSLLYALLALPTPLVAQPSISLQSTPATLRETDEYFTDVQATRRDFSDPCQVGYDSWFFKPESIINQSWNANNPAAPAAYFSPLPNAQPGALDASIEDCYQFGEHIPIDAARFTSLSWKMYSSQPGSFQVLWGSNAQPPLGGLNGYDGIFLPAIAVQTPAFAWTIKRFDLNNTPVTVPWNGTITGVLLRPSNALPAGGSVGMDWMRIYDPSTAPQVSVSWQSVDTSGNMYVNLFLDSDYGGYNGSEISRFHAANGNLQFETGFLPPGTHYIYAELTTNNLFTEDVIARSEYSQPITINGKPTLRFTSPSRVNLGNPANQREYFRDDVGNAADFSDPADVTNLTFFNGTPQPDSAKGFTNHSFAGGLFSAISLPSAIDTQVHLNTPSNTPIHPEHYRYFCHRMQADTSAIPRNGDPNALNNAGQFMRVVWFRRGTNREGRSRGHFLIERSPDFPTSANNYTRDGFSTYCIDLWDPTTLETMPGFPAEQNLHWLEMGTVTGLRHDPLEATPATAFALDDVWLLSENSTDAQRRFNIEWTVDDPENDGLQIQLFFDNDRTGFNGTPIVTLGAQQAGQGGYVWDASSVANGTYYIYAVLSDGINTSRFYSREYVRVQNGLPNRPTQRAPSDFDGDGMSDLAVIRGPKTATTIARLSATTTGRSVTWGDVGFDIFLDVDVDGDRISDINATRAIRNPTIEWFHQLSFFTVPSVALWGQRGDIPVSADIDGDEIDDTLVWRPDDGMWWAIRSSLGLSTTQWGLPGDLPVAADYDGDGWDDLAVWRPNFGAWFVLQSTQGASPDPDKIIFKQFGLPGDHPMPGDYDGDGRADLVVWRADVAYWFICPSSTGFDCTQSTLQQFGLPGDFPVKGDFDGDGVLDFAVFRPSNAIWFWRRSSDGQLGMAAWGQPGDIPLSMGIRDTVERLH